MALSILDGNQSATTLSTILSGGQHITAHTVVSLGTQAITDMRSAVSGSVVTANIGGIANSVTLPVRLFAEKYGESPSNQDTLVVCNSDGMLLVDANVSGESVLGFDGNAFVQVKQVSGSSVTIGNSVTIGSLPAIFADPSGFTTVVAGISDVEVNTIRSVLWIPQENGSDGEMLSQANPLPISGTVTANSSNGELTTRFGSITTANTAFSTTAVTNTSRKYLMIQNIASTVITAGIGFTPTTTQGIQIVAGATITFDGNYIPTGAVRILSSVTASNFTVLEA
jgi:hypothetical protein